MEPIKLITSKLNLWIEGEKGRGEGTIYAAKPADKLSQENVQAWFFRVVFNIKPLWDWV